MPSFLQDVTSEPVKLEASGSSEYEPPKASLEKPCLQSAIPTGHFMNGNVFDSSFGSKLVDEPLSTISNGVNASHQSLTNGRSSGSTHSQDWAQTREGGLEGSSRKNAGAINEMKNQKVSDPQNSVTGAHPNSTQLSNKALDPRAPTNGETSTTTKNQTVLTQNRHQRANSLNNPETPSAKLPRESGSSHGSTHPNSDRFSSPPMYPASGHAAAASSVTSLHPGAARLQHRHTLQVPRLSTNGNSRDSREFSWANTNASDDAITNVGRFSPTTASGRKDSISLARKTTRSIHSDMNLEWISPDGDMAKWADTIREKRASRRRRKEEEEDDRVVVGTKVDMNHVNWVTAYNMLTGIRFTVSRTNAKLDRELTDQDFDARHKFSFDITGNELTPSAKYDFKFKDYAPWVFRHLRNKFRLDPADFLMSLTSKYILSELGSPGKSGSFFYFSRDYKYIIKTIHHAEHKLLRKILREYYAHVTQNPNTLISQFYGLHRVKLPYGRKIHFVVMNNLFPPHRDIHQTFDLKGSTIGRDFKEEDLERNPRATLKDLNWLRREYHLEFGPQKKNVFIHQMERDVALLQRLKIMDYSLLVGIHDLSKGNDENLRDKTLQVFQPGGDRPDEPQPNMLTRTPSKLENARKARELRQIIRKEKPMPMDQSTNKMPDTMLDERRNFLFYSDDGGFRATHDNGQPGEEIYYLGIIDCLTHYGLVKKAEHFWKGMSHNKSLISPIPPEGYGDRFVKFITSITMTREESSRAKQSNDQADGSVDMNRNSTHTLSRSSTDRFMEKVERHVRKTEARGATEDESADRTLTVARSPSAERSGGLTGHVLPVVEEAGEAGSTGGRSARSRERESSVKSEKLPDHAPGIFVEHAQSPPLGGKPPPTPPKDTPVRDKQLPSLPNVPRLSPSPTPNGLSDS